MRIRLATLFACMVLLVVGVGAAPLPHLPAVQLNADCTALVTRALEALGNNCSLLEDTSACYGYNQVLASFFQPQAAGFFTRPADRAALPDLETIQTSPLNLESDQWGIAVMSLRANLPNTLPGQQVTFLLLGDAAVNNDVLPDQAVAAATPVPVTTLARLNLHSGPGLNSNVLRLIEANSTLDVDALSEDGGWLRTSVDGVPGWINRAVVTAPAELTTLPVVGETSRTPMQAFYFSTGVGQPLCEEAPSLVAIQSPDGLHVEMTVNGATIRVGSTITLQTLPDNSIALTVHQGSVETEVGVIALTGETLIAQLDENNNIISWLSPRPATPQELGVARTVGLAFGVLAGQPIITTQTTPGQCAGPVTHIVAPGQNLYRIALQYDTSISSIAAANGITDPTRIYAGQQLIVPSPCSGFVNDFTPPAVIINPPPVSPGQPVVPVGGVDCSTFRPTSPLDGLPYGTASFFWDPAPGATNYRVTIYNNETGAALSYNTAGTETRLSAPVNDSRLGSGFSFSWQVTALLNGVDVCSTARVSIPRAAPSEGGGDNGGGSNPPPACVVGANCNCNAICEPSYPNFETNLTCPADCP